MIPTNLHLKKEDEIFSGPKRNPTFVSLLDLSTSLRGELLTARNIAPVILHLVITADGTNWKISKRRSLIDIATSTMRGGQC